jgi:hypothetical protein
MSARYVATINVPGYLPMDDEPPVFDTAAEAWSYLASERERDEDDFADDSEYSDTVTYLRYSAGNEVQYGSPHEDYPLNPDGTGTIYGDTPGYDGSHDLGLAYSVTAVEENEL